MLSFHVKFVQTGRRTDRRTTVKQYGHDLSMQGHKNEREKGENAACHHFLFFQQGLVKPFFLRINKTAWSVSYEQSP